jgi:hypothetical protein
MLKFEVEPYSYKVKYRDNNLILSATHQQKFHKWETMFTNLDDMARAHLAMPPAAGPAPGPVPASCVNGPPIVIGISTESLYELLKDYANGTLSALVTFEFQKKKILYSDNLEVKIRFKVQSWNGSYADITLLPLKPYFRSHEIRLMKRLESQYMSVVAQQTNNYTKNVLEYLDKNYPPNSHARKLIDATLDLTKMDKSQISSSEIYQLSNLIVHHTIPKSSSYAI